MSSAEARKQLHASATERGLTSAAAYVENSPSLAPPQVLCLLKDCRLCDILLIEHVDRLSRLLATAQHNAGGAGMPQCFMPSPYVNVRVKIPVMMNVRYEGVA